MVRTIGPGPTFIDFLLFIAEEIPIRLAHRVKELEELPPDLRAMPSILKVKHWYAESFQVQ